MLAAAAREEEGARLSAQLESDAKERAVSLWRIDCHVHTEKSGDSRTPVIEALRAATAKGVNVVCITDHGRIDGAIEALEHARTHGIDVEVVVGQECRTWAGELIGLFLTERIPGNSQPEEVVDHVKSQGGLVYIPHPFCPHHAGLRRNVLEALVERGLVDIIEVHNAKADPAANAEAERFARLLGLLGVAASDAHYPEFIGTACVEVVSYAAEGHQSPTQSPQHFLSALRSGRLVRGTYSYADATWQTRFGRST